jgi:hypothetical protein
LDAPFRLEGRHLPRLGWARVLNLTITLDTNVQKIPGIVVSLSIAQALLSVVVASRRLGSSAVTSRSYRHRRRFRVCVYPY